MKNTKNMISTIYQTLHASDMKELEVIYTQWASHYEHDVIKLAGYVGHIVTTEILLRYLKNTKSKILDAGCGTGLVGVELKKYGYTNFDGVDLSQKLLDLVPNGLYKNLSKTDLNKLLNINDNEYDAILCVGTFTFGHVKPTALDEFIRITKNKGLICFTINEGIYEEYGFDKKINELTEKNLWKKKEFFKSNYISSKDVNAWLGLYEVIK